MRERGTLYDPFKGVYIGPELPHSLLRTRVFRGAGCARTGLRAAGLRVERPTSDKP